MNFSISHIKSAQLVREPAFSFQVNPGVLNVSAVRPKAERPARKVCIESNSVDCIVPYLPECFILRASGL